MSLNSERKYQYYLCGQCNTLIEYEQDSNPPIPCPDCGWIHLERKKYDLPEEIKYPIQ